MTELETLRAEIAKRDAVIAALKADSQRKLSCKVSEKGGVSVYGTGRFPITLYRSQWEQLITFVKSGAVERFMEANASLLSTKADKA
jgi:hypothetical protein